MGDIKKIVITKDEFDDISPKNALSISDNEFDDLDSFQKKNSSNDSQPSSSFVEAVGQNSPIEKSESVTPFISKEQIKSNNQKTLQLNNSNVVKQKLAEDFTKNPDPTYQKAYIDKLSEIGYDKDKLNEFAKNINFNRSGQEAENIAPEDHGATPTDKDNILDKASGVIGDYIDKQATQVGEGAKQAAKGLVKAYNPTSSFSDIGTGALNVAGGLAKGAFGAVSLVNPEAIAINGLTESVHALPDDYKSTIAQAINPMVSGLPKEKQAEMFDKAIDLPFSAASTIANAVIGSKNADLDKRIAKAKTSMEGQPKDVQDKYKTYISDLESQKSLQEGSAGKATIDILDAVGGIFALKAVDRGEAKPTIQDSKSLISTINKIKNGDATELELNDYHAFTQSLQGITPDDIQHEAQAQGKTDVANGLQDLKDKSNIINDNVDVSHHDTAHDKVASLETTIKSPEFAGLPEDIKQNLVKDHAEESKSLADNNTNESLGHNEQGNIAGEVEQTKTIIDNTDDENIKQAAEEKLKTLTNDTTPIETPDTKEQPTDSEAVQGENENTNNFQSGDGSPESQGETKKTLFEKVNEVEEKSGKKLSTEQRSDVTAMFQDKEKNYSVDDIVKTLNPDYKVEVNANDVGQNLSKDETATPIEETKEERLGDNRDENKTVGVSHAALNKLAKQLGLPEIKRGSVLKPEQYADIGRKMLKDGVDPNTILDANIDQHEKISISRAYLEELIKKSDSIKDKTSDEYKTLSKQIEDYETKVVKKLGTGAAKSFIALQGKRDLVTDSFFEAERTLKENLGIAELSKEQIEKLQKQTEEIQSLKKNISDLEQKLKDSVDKELGDKDFIDKSDKKSVETNRQKRIKKVDKFFDDAIAKISSKGAAYSTFIPPDVIKVALKGMKEAYHAGEEIGKIVEDAVKFISDKIKKDWDKEKFTKDYTDSLTKITKELQTPEEKNIARLEKEIEDLKQGKIKDRADKRERTEKEKKLEDEREKLKQELGLKNRPLTDEEKLLLKKENGLQSAKDGTEKEKTEKEYNLSDEEKTKLDDLNEEIKNIKLTKITKELQTQFANKKDNLFTPEQAKSLYNYGKEVYLNNGVSWDDMVQYTSSDMGLTPDQVRNAIISPKSKPISIEKWKAQAELRKNRNATQQYIDNQSQSFLLRQAKKTSGDIRDVATFGHGHIFLGTHAGLTLFSNPQLWTKAYLKGLDLAYRMKPEEVEQFQHDFENRPLWAVFNKAGLQNDLHKIGNDMEIASQSHFLDLARKLHRQENVIGGTAGKLLVGGVEAGHKGFMAIKWLRQELAEQSYNKLTEEQKSNEDVLKSISQLYNNATGATNVKLSGGVNDIIKEVLFAGGMEVSRWEKILKNPAKAMATIPKLIAGGKVKWINELPPQERVFAAIWTKRVMTQVLVYGGVVAISKMIFHKDNETPLESLKKSIGAAEGMKINLGKNEVLDPTSGMVSALSLLGKIYDALPSNASYNTNYKEKNKEDKHTISDVLGTYGRYKLAPTYQTAAEKITGKDALGNATPFTNIKGDNAEPDYKKHKLTWGEYAESKAPIPFAEGLSSYNESKSVAIGILNGIISAMFGFKSYSKDKK